MVSLCYLNNRMMFMPCGYKWLILKGHDVTNSQHWLIWDGDWGFWGRVTAWVRRRDKERKFNTIPFQKCPSPPMTPELYQACIRSVHVITSDGKTLKAGQAAMYILEEIGYPRWLVRPFTWPPLVWFTELGYRIVERNRPFFSKFLFTK